METLTTHLEAASEVPVPPDVWEDLTLSLDAIATRVMPLAQMALRITSDDGIRALNSAFRGTDAATDVLSFPAEEQPEPEYSPGRGRRRSVRRAPLAGHAGDIALSWDAVKRQAAANGNSPLVEAVALTVHGMLHLAGYDHRDEAEQAEMDHLTRTLCRSVGIEVERFGH
jgi:probable rRNA maturation factor